MIDSFKAAVEATLNNEKGYVNDVNDPGGETKYGISKRSYPELDIKNLTEEEANAIYWVDFWKKFKCDRIETSIIAEKFFDMCVSMGGRQATLCLQRACKACGTDIKDDGIIGEKTLGAVNDICNELLNPLRSEAAGYYRLIAALHPKNEKYVTGWLNRAYS